MFFEVGSYKVHIYSQSVSHRNSQQLTANSQQLLAAWREQMPQTVPPTSCLRIQTFTTYKTDNVHFLTIYRQLRFFGQTQSPTLSLCAL